MTKRFLAPIGLANISADPTGLSGAFYYNTSANTLKYYNGSTWGTLQDLSTAQTITGVKTFSTAPTIDIINAASATSTSAALFSNITTGSSSVGGAVTTGTINIGTAVGSAVGTGTINIGTSAGIASGVKAINIGTGLTAGTATIALGDTLSATTITGGTLNLVSQSILLKYGSANYFKLYNPAANSSQFQSPDTSAASTQSFNMYIVSGNASGTTSNSGGVWIDSGTATGTTGTISIGTTNSSTITIGRTSGVTTTINGTTIPASATIAVVGSNNNFIASQTITGTITANSFIPTSSTIPVNGDFLPATNSVGIATNSTERMRIDSSGNVSINTTSSNIRSSSGGQFLTLAGSAAPGAVFELYNINTDGTGNYSTIVFGANSAGLAANKSIAQIEAFTSGTTVNNRGGTLIFSTKADGGSEAERMRIDSSGNVGINTTSMTGKFNVQGPSAGVSAYFTDAVNSSLVVNNILGGVTLGTDSGGGIHLATNGYASGNRRLSIDSTGIVGIGATPSGAMFTVVNNTAGNVGTIIKGATSQAGDLLQVQNSAGTPLAKIDYLGNLTATKFVTTSGTSSQFVKGDGSLDSTTYLTPANYNSYAPSLTGTSASGTWGISISGNSATASSATSATTATYLNSAQSSTDMGAISSRINSGFYQNSAPTTSGGWPVTGSWYHLLATTHSNTANYYSMQIAGDFFSNSNFYIRSTNGSGTTAWTPIITGVGGQTISGNLTLSGTISGLAAAGTATTSSQVGYMGLPQNLNPSAYTLAAADSGKHIYYTTSGQTLTIPANGTLALPIGFSCVVVNAAAVTTSIAITTDTLILAGTGSTGTRTLAPYGMATLVKITATSWMISGNGLT